MRIVVAPDSFKGSLSSPEAAAAIKAGVLTACPDAQVTSLPLADGGEGTVRALVSATGGFLQTRLVRGPLGDEVEAEYGILGDGKTAVIEMAAAAGLNLVPAELRNPLITSTFGVGELILAVAEQGLRRVIVGVGGSATNDGGAGALQALGVRLLDDQGHELEPGGGQLDCLSHIDMSNFRLHSGIEILIACDVDNSLTGPNGASYIYGPQKGADPAMVEILDKALQHYAQVIHRELNRDISSLKGAGAAGGLAGGLAAFTNARLQSGIDLVLDANGFDEKVSQADLVMTGEGRIDQQTLSGKAVMGALLRARLFSVPVVALAGQVGPGAESLYSLGIAGIFSVVDGPTDESEAIARAAQLLEKTSRSVTSLFAAASVSSPPAL